MDVVQVDDGRPTMKRTVKSCLSSVSLIKYGAGQHLPVKNITPVKRSLPHSLIGVGETPIGHKACTVFM